MKQLLVKHDIKKSYHRGGEYKCKVVKMQLKLRDHEFNHIYIYNNNHIYILCKK